MKFIVSLTVVVAVLVAAIFATAKSFSLNSTLTSAAVQLQVGRSAGFLRNQIHTNMDAYVTKLADEGVVKCQAVGKQVDHLTLKSEWLACTRFAISSFFASLATIFTRAALNPELDGLGVNLFRLQNSEEPIPSLTPEQKSLLKSEVIRPVCGAVNFMLEPCGKYQRYDALVKARSCLTRAERESRDLAWTFLSDLCGADMQWLFDFSEAVSLREFVERTEVFAMTDSFQENLMYLLLFTDKSLTLGFKRLATKDDFCNVTATAGELLTGLFVTSSGAAGSNAADILRAAFKTTIESYKNKCRNHIIGLHLQALHTTSTPPPSAKANQLDTQTARTRTQTHSQMYSSVDAYVTKLADEGVEKCQAVGKEIDHLALKSEWLDCTRVAISNFVGELVNIFTNAALDPELDGLDTDLFWLQSSESTKLGLTAKQKSFLQYNGIKPVCYAVKDLFEYCENLSYYNLVKARSCNTKAENESRDLAWTFLRDILNSDVRWLIDFFEAVSLPEFVQKSLAFANTDEFKEMLKYLLQFENKSLILGFKRLRMQVEFCNVTVTAGELLTGLFITPSGPESKAADILRTNFKTTIESYKKKCGGEYY